jgi:hypothetical protein
MFFSTHYVGLSPDTTINLISSYKNIRNKFILLYIEKKDLDYKEKKELYSDALIYSKYYLYWKIYGCVYSDEIMNILYDIEFLN